MRRLTWAATFNPTLSTHLDFDYENGDEPNEDEDERKDRQQASARGYTPTRSNVQVSCESSGAAGSSGAATTGAGAAGGKRRKATR